MAAQISQNRQMFWRITRRMLGAHRGRLLVVLLALGAGAAVTAALLNLQVDANKRLTAEFNAFGPNFTITPRSVEQTSAVPATLPEEIGTELLHMGLGAHVGPFLYLSGQVSGQDSGRLPAMIVGMMPFYFDLLEPAFQITPRLSDVRSNDCMVGAVLASRLRHRNNDLLHVFVGGRQYDCRANRTVSSGGEEDNQVFVSVLAAQTLGNVPERVGLFQGLLPGSPRQVQGQITLLQQHFPTAEVRSIRQFTESEARIYGRISGLLTATVFVVLVLTSLCVMAAMTNVAMERKNDVGLMKAIGGATRRVVRLFLAEAALLGLAGGLLGAAAGILLSIWLGKQVFGVAAEPRLIVYPVAVVLTVIVAILSAFPLRRLASVRPASVFRGEA